MNRREFLKGAATVGAVAATKAAAAKTWRDFEVADGKYWLHELSAEPVLAAVSETSVAVSWAVGRLATGGVEIADNPEMRNARYVKSGEMPLAEPSSVSLRVRVTDLKPATRYWYRTVTDEVKSVRHPLYAGIKPKESACPTIVEGVVEKGELVIRVHDAWRGGELSTRRFASRAV